MEQSLTYRPWTVGTATVFVPACLKSTTASSLRPTVVHQPQWGLLRVLNARSHHLNALSGRPSPDRRGGFPLFPNLIRA
jgi:hypothetical protein